MDYFLGRYVQVRKHVVLLTADPVRVIVTASSLYVFIQNNSNGKIIAASLQIDTKGTVNSIHFILLPIAFDIVCCWFNGFNQSGSLPANSLLCFTRTTYNRIPYQMKPRVTVFLNWSRMPTFHSQHMPTSPFWPWWQHCSHKMSIWCMHKPAKLWDFLRKVHCYLSSSRYLDCIRKVHICIETLLWICQGKISLYQTSRRERRKQVVYVSSGAKKAPRWRRIAGNDELAHFPAEFRML